MGSIMRGFGTLIGLLVIASWVFGGLMTAGVVPSDRVLAGADIPGDQMQVLLEEGIVSKDEVIELFYSEGLISVREGGSVLTDERVIAYEEDYDDEVAIYSIRVRDINSIEMIQEGDTLNFQVYEVASADQEDWLELWLPHEHGDADRFAAAVEAKIHP